VGIPVPTAGFRPHVSAQRGCTRCAGRLASRRTLEARANKAHLRGEKSKEANPNNAGWHKDEHRSGGSRWQPHRWLCVVVRAGLIGRNCPGLFFVDCSFLVPDLTHACSSLAGRHNLQPTIAYDNKVASVPGGSANCDTRWARAVLPRRRGGPAKGLVPEMLA